MTSYFIAGTGTDVGKTLFTCALAYRLHVKNRHVQAIKPVLSGFDAHKLETSDTGLLLAAQGLPLDSDAVADCSPWRFAAPLSPDMAARDEGRELDFSALLHFCKRVCAKGDTLIESAGGICSPLDDRHTMLDWAERLGLPVVLIAGSYLGALSHTLTAAQTVFSRGMALHGLVVSESANSGVPLARTVASLRRFLPDALPILQIVRLDSRAELWKYAPDMTHHFFP